MVTTATRETDLAVLNAIEVDIDDVVEYLDQNDLSSPSETSGDAAVILRDPVKLAIGVRLDALHELMENGVLDNWLEVVGEKEVALHCAVLEAAATHPLIESDDHFTFDDDAFLANVLLQAKAAGSA